MEESICSVRAKFKGCNIQEGKTVMQFTLDPEDNGRLPKLVTLTGQYLTMELSSDQLVIPIDGETGEVVEEVEAEAYEPDWPMALPGPIADEAGGYEAA